MLDTQLIRFNDIALMVNRGRGGGMINIARDSRLMASHLKQSLQGKQCRQGLDIGCGTGILALTLAPFCDSVVAVDINPAAVEFTEKNIQLNHAKNIKVINSNLFSEIGNKRFDIIVSNAVYDFHPDTLKPKESSLINYERGLRMPYKILEEAPAYLTETGELHLICGSPIVGEDIVLGHLKKIRWGSVMLVPVRYDILPEYYRFHKASSCSHFILYIVVVKKGKQGLEVKRMPWGSYLMNMLKMQLMVISTYINRCD
ncbi:MAG TPA: class I SAM-dependent methyltransferase [Candidatus Bilamarchaeaceae archaeon]|nr:class I SAM-dependent methyltransferase [Candidatus Bilamarchaeaceae archaeon]